MQIKFPLYKAEVAPDIKFFGFDLTIEEARGAELTDPFADHLGWFFVLQEVPGEPRFGMDISFSQGTDGLSWDDLAWNNFAGDMKFIRRTQRPDPDIGAIVNPANNADGEPQWGVDSGKMAYILFQKPSMVAVHAKEMLANLNK